MAGDAWLDEFTTELKVPPQLEFASLVETFAADAAQRSDLVGEQSRGLVNAVRENFKAIVQDALAESREPIRVEAVCTSAERRLSIFERGLPVDDAFARRDPGWNQLSAGVDAVHWCLHGTAGSELRLRVNRLSDVPPPPSHPPFRTKSRSRHHSSIRFAVLYRATQQESRGHFIKLRLRLRSPRGLRPDQTY